MPKHINADALADRLDALACDEWNQRASTTWADALKDFAEMVRSEPTVESIPIEWVIKHYLKSDPSLYTKEDCIIENMLIDWEKENE